MKLSPMSGARIAVAIFWSSWFEERTSATSSPAKRIPRPKRTSSARRRPSIALASEELRYCRPGEIALGDEPTGAAAGDERTKVRRVAAGRQNDGGSAVVCGDLLGYLEAVEVRKVDVEQDEVRVQAMGLGDGSRAVGGLADHVVALCLEQHPGGRPKRRVIVDDEDCCDRL